MHKDNFARLWVIEHLCAKCSANEIVVVVEVVADTVADLLETSLVNEAT